MYSVQTEVGVENMIFEYVLYGWALTPSASPMYSILSDVQRFLEKFGDNPEEIGTDVFWYSLIKNPFE